MNSFAKTIVLSLLAITQATDLATNSNDKEQATDDIMLVPML